MGNKYMKIGVKNKMINKADKLPYNVNIIA